MESSHPGSGQWVGIKDLRDGLSRYLDRVRHGGTITITDHGKPVARIVPVGRLTGYEQMKLDGRITPGRSPKRPAPEPIKTAGPVTDLIAEQRGPADGGDEPRV